MNWSDIILTSGLTTVSIGVVGFLLKEWVSIRIKESVGAEYKKALEIFKNQIAWEERRKQQAAELAELFSIWMQANYDKKKDVNLIRYELQKKYWELVLWLDATVLQAVHKALKSSANPGIKHKEALISVRRIYIGENDPIRPDELFHWDPIPITAESPEDKEHA
jgi:hypothetical protein